MPTLLEVMERDVSHAMSAISHSHGGFLCENISEFTQGRNHTSVISVGNLSPRKGLFRVISWYIRPEKFHKSVTANQLVVVSADIPSTVASKYTALLYIIHCMVSMYYSVILYEFAVCIYAVC
jgi:hypothetical protein